MFLSQILGGFERVGVFGVGEKKSQQQQQPRSKLGHEMGNNRNCFEGDCFCLLVFVFFSNRKPYLFSKKRKCLSCKRKNRYSQLFDLRYQVLNCPTQIPHAEF